MRSHIKEKACSRKIFGISSLAHLKIAALGRKIGLPLRPTGNHPFEPNELSRYGLRHAGRASLYRGRSGRMWPRDLGPRTRPWPTALEMQRRGIGIRTQTGAERGDLWPDANGFGIPGKPSGKRPLGWADSSVVK